MFIYGSLSEVDRINGIQGDAIREISGTLGFVGGYDFWNSGCFQTFGEKYGWNGGGYQTWRAKFNITGIVPLAQENRVKNRLIRIYKRIS